MTMVMNKDAWDDIPAEDQAIIEEINAEIVDVVLDLVWAQENAAAAKLTGEFGVTAVQFEEMDALRAFGQKSWENWVADMYGKGIDGQALIDQYQALYQAALKTN